MQETAIVDIGGYFGLAKAATCKHLELGPTIARLYEEMTAENPDAVLNDAPCLYYTDWRPEECDVLAVLPVEGGTAARYFEPCKALQGVHVGPYEGLAEAWSSLWSYVQENNIDASGTPWDRYVTDPGTEPDSSKWITEIYIPIRVQKIS